MSNRRKLVPYRVSGIDPETHERVVWDILLNSGSKDDIREWRTMANAGGFTEISMTRVKPHVEHKTPKTTKTGNEIITGKSFDPREALALLDSILAARKGQTA